MKRIVKLFLALMFVVLAVSCSQNKSANDDLLLPVKIGNSWGYINSNGKYVVNLQFENADFFNDGMALVKSAGKYGYIDQCGTLVIPTQYKSATQFSEGMAFVVKEGGCPICIDKQGNELFRLKDAKYVYAFDNGMASFCTFAEKCGFVDKTGNIVEYVDFDNTISYSEGLAVVERNKKFGFIDQTGKIVIEPQFDEVRNFSEGLAAFKVGDKWGFINKEGVYVVNPQFDNVGNFCDGKAWLHYTEKDSVKHVHYGFVDKKGRKKMIDFNLGSIYYITNNLVVYGNGEKYGVVNQKGKIVFDMLFDNIKLSNKKNSICVRSDDKFTQSRNAKMHNGHEYVDLGLSVMWATCNLGAYSPEQKGNKYALGETKTKENFTKANYKWKNMSWNIEGVFLPQFDAASVNWGGKWRLPTSEEVYELKNNCVLKELIVEGVTCYEIKNKNRCNSIFFPCQNRNVREYLVKDVKGTAQYWKIINNSISVSSTYFPEDGRYIRPVFDPN